MRETCAINGAQSAVCSVLPFVPLAVTVVQTGNEITGTITMNMIAIEVAGTVGRGELRLTGYGSGVRGTVTLTEWITSDVNGAMTGRFRYTIVTPQEPRPLTVTAVLDSVIKPGAAPIVAVLPDPPVKIRADAASTLRSPTVTRYGACYWVDNFGRDRAQLTFTVIPVGSDGTEYDVEQATPASPPSVPGRGFLTGCGSADARDFNPLRPLASAYRLRVEYRYPDGTGGVIEERGSVTAR